MTPEELDL